MLSLLLAAGLFASASSAKPAAKGGDLCGTVKKLVAAADKADGFTSVRGEVSAKDPSGAANAWSSKITVPGAQKCWVLAMGALVECDFAGGNEKAGWQDLDAKVHSCLKGKDWKDSSLGFGANGGPKTALAKGKTAVTVEIVPAEKGERAHPRLTVFQPQSDDGSGLLDDE